MLLKRVEQESCFVLLVVVMILVVCANRHNDSSAALTLINALVVCGVRARLRRTPPLGNFGHSIKYISLHLIDQKSGTMNPTKTGNKTVSFALPFQVSSAQQVPKKRVPNSTQNDGIYVTLLGRVDVAFETYPFVMASSSLN